MNINNQSYPIIISGYSSASSVLSTVHCKQACYTPNGVINGSQLSGSPKNVKVSSTIYDSGGSSGQSLGSITYNLENSSGAIVQSQSVTPPKLKPVSLSQSLQTSTTVTFNQIVPGVYYVSSSSISASPTAVTVPSNQSYFLTGNYISGSGGNSTPTCESSSFSLAWLMCAVINEIGNMESSLEKVVQSLLKTQPLVYSSSQCQSSSQGSSTQACIYKVWSSFRIYADILLVIGVLVIIFAESIGGGLIDAYSLRKILPRILAAAILINLSIYIVGALMDITNILGNGIFDLIKAPFGTQWKVDPNGASGSIIGISFAALIGVGAFSIWKILKGQGKSILDAVIGLLFLIGLPVLLAIIGVLVTIILRIGIIYFLTMISPIAFALYVLPNTEQYFKKWWKILFEALLVYPIVMIVFAMSGVAGIIITGLSLPGTISWISQILGIAATVSPLFLIPFAFKIAGGTIGAIHDGVTKFRQQGNAAIKGDSRDPNSLRNRMKLRLKTGRNELGASNQAIGTWLNPKYLSRGGRSKRRTELAERRQAEGNRLASQALDNNAIWQNHKNDERFKLAYANREEATAKMNAAREKGNDHEANTWDQAIRAADLVPKSSGAQAGAFQDWAASGFEVSEGLEGYKELSRVAAKISGAKVHINDEGKAIFDDPKSAEAAVYSRMMDNAQFAERQAGNIHLGGLNHGSGYDSALGLSKVGDYQLSQSKTASYKAGFETNLGFKKSKRTANDTDQDYANKINQDAEGMLANIRNAGSREDRAKRVSQIDEWATRLISGLPTAKGANKTEIEDQLERFKAVAAADPNGEYLTPGLANKLNSIGSFVSGSSSGNIPQQVIEEQLRNRGNPPEGT